MATKTEQGHDSFTFAVDAAAQVVKGQQKRERDHEKEMRVRFGRLVRDFDRFHRGYKKLLQLHLPVELSMKQFSATGLRPEEWEFFVAQREAGCTKVNIHANTNENHDRILAMRFEMKGEDIALLGFNLGTGSDTVTIVTSHYEKRWTKNQTKAEERLDRHVDTGDKNSLSVGEHLMAYAMARTEEFARRIAAGGK